MLIKKTTMLLAGAALLGGVSFTSVASAQDFSRGMQLDNSQMESITAAGKHGKGWKKYKKIVILYYKHCGSHCNNPPAPPAPPKKGKNKASADADSFVLAPDTYDTKTRSNAVTEILTSGGVTTNNSSSSASASSGPAKHNGNGNGNGNHNDH